MGYLTRDFVNDIQPWHNATDGVGGLRQDLAGIQNLSAVDCITRYTQAVAGQRDVLLVSENFTMADGMSFDPDNINSSLIYSDRATHEGIYWRYNTEWLCSAFPGNGRRSRMTCTKQHLLPFSDVWTITTRVAHPAHPTEGLLWVKIAYCLTTDGPQSMEDKCGLRVSKAILAVVTVLNAVKCICIAYTARLHSQEHKRAEATSTAGTKVWNRTMTRAYRKLFKDKQHAEQPVPYLVTIGDAIASFLESPCRETEGHVFATKKDFCTARDEAWPTSFFSPNKASIRWYRAASVRRWLITLLL